MEPGGQEISFKDFSTLNFGDHFVQRGETDWTILVKDLTRNICVMYLKFGPVCSCHLFVFFLSLVVILFVRVKSYGQF